jgi:hypothetical protein
VIGTTDAGGARALLMVSLGPEGRISVEEVAGDLSPRFYASETSTATLTSNGGRAKGDVVERDTAAPYALHIQGTANCGTPIRS